MIRWLLVIGDLKRQLDSLFALKSDNDAEAAALRKQLGDMAAAKDVADQRISHLENQNKGGSDEVANLKKQLADLTSAKAAADRRITDLETQSKHDQVIIFDLKIQLDSLLALKGGR